VSNAHLPFVCTEHRGGSEMEQIQSSDGTAIAVERSGTGPPLVLVHGVGSSHTVWAAVVPLLGAHATVYALDRRGHGQSGDGPTYALEREAEDLLAVLTWIDAPATLLGWSFGGRCALAAALRTPRLGKLIVYEPTVRAVLDPPLFARIDAFIATGAREQAIIALLRGVTGMPQAEIERRQGLPDWPEWVATAPYTVREWRAAHAAPFDVASATAIAAPTLVLVGGESPPPVKERAQTLAASLPHGHLSELSGQGHWAPQAAPELFAAAVLSFLTIPA
jgi:pimeloyl-ACP methyl ester carboxylesterase